MSLRHFVQNMPQEVKNSLCAVTVLATHFVNRIARSAASGCRIECCGATLAANEYD